MEAQVFNPAQLHLLQMMSYVRTESDLQDLHEAIAAYYARKADEGLDALCASGTITPDTIEQWGTEHMRTPY